MVNQLIESIERGVRWDLSSINIRRYSGSILPRSKGVLPMLLPNQVAFSEAPDSVETRSMRIRSSGSIGIGRCNIL